MPLYQQKIDNRESQIASPDDSPAATDIVIRLWGANRNMPFSWKTDSVLVYMIADLVGASHGQIAAESSEMSARFGTARQAIVAARRVQMSILEFLACRPSERVGSAILIYGSQASGPPGSSTETVHHALRQVLPGQILLAENICGPLRELPGIELRAVPVSSTVMGNGQTKLTELIWTTPDRVALFQKSVGHDDEASSDDVASVGATVIVHSSLARVVPPTEAALPVMGAGDVSGDISETAPLRVGQVADQRSAPLLKELPEKQNSSVPEGLAEFGERPFLTATRMILGIVAIVLVAALIAILYRPARVSQPPIPLRQHQTARDIPGKPIEPQGASAQSDQQTGNEETAKPPSVQSQIVKPQNVKPQIYKPPRAKSAASAATTTVAVQPQTIEKPSADNFVKNQKEGPESAIYSDDSGGVSVKDIPMLLRMAQQDAGAGNYDKARTEYRKILRLQPNNQDAKDGLHKLDLIQKEQP